MHSALTLLHCVLRGSAGVSDEADTNIAVIGDMMDGFPLIVYCAFVSLDCSSMSLS